MKGEIYLARMTSTGAIKIGFTTDLAARVASLWYVVPGGVSVITSFLGTPDAETYLHKKFAHRRISGEWFEAAEDLLDFIERVKVEGNLVVPSLFRADEIEEKQPKPGEAEARHRASFYLKRISEPVRADEKIRDRMKNAATRTGISESRVEDIWRLEARSITAAEYLRIKEIYEARLIAGMTPNEMREDRASLDVLDRAPAIGVQRS